MQRLLLSLAAALTLMTSTALAEVQPKPTYADVSYGPYKMDKLDFWEAKGEGPRPLLVYIHGGGWIGGDKARLPGNIKTFLDKG
ncbi:MAG: alpha/beta hydrolase, partial [Gimesia chilikensis]